MKANFGLVLMLTIHLRETTVSKPKDRIFLKSLKTQFPECDVGKRLELKNMALVCDWVSVSILLLWFYGLKFCPETNLSRKKSRIWSWKFFVSKKVLKKVSELVSFIFWVWENCWRVRRRGREAGRLAECSPYHLPPPDLPECCPHGSAPLPVFHNIPPRNRQRASPAAAAAYNCWANCSCLAAAAGAGRAAADLASTEEEHNCPSIWIGWYWRHQVIKSALIPSRGQLAVVSSSRDSWPCESRGMSALPHSRTSGLHTALQWVATAGGEEGIQTDGERHVPVAKSRN